MFARAEKGRGLKVVYHRKDGTRLIRTGGSPAWRNSNPGNIRSSKFAKDNGSIGDVNNFAVFPDYETGRRALSRLLRGEKYRNLNIFNAVSTYAPPEDKNDVENYRKLLKQFTKLDLSRKLKSLAAEEFQLVLDAIQRIEGWKPGTEELISPSQIVAVRRNKKGVIVAYQVQGKGWFSKTQLIALIETEGGVDAVVVRASGRKPFIRMRPDSTRLNNLNVG